MNIFKGMIAWPSDRNREAQIPPRTADYGRFKPTPNRTPTGANTFPVRRTKPRSPAFW
jgi:hypothetical protein